MTTGGTRTCTLNVPPDTASLHVAWDDPSGGYRLDILAPDGTAAGALHYSGYRDFTAPAPGAWHFVLNNLYDREAEGSLIATLS